MTKRILLCWFSLFFCYTILLAGQGMPSKSSENLGTIEGKVVNLTPGGERVDNLEVILRRYEGNQEVEKGTTKTDEKGNFRFLNLSLRERSIYEPMVTYKGVEYYGNPIRFAKEEKIKEAGIAVYDTTQDPSNLKLLSQHTIMDVQKGALLITELFQIKNEGKRSYVGNKEVIAGKTETFFFPVPRGYKDLRLLEGLMECCIAKGEEGMSDTIAMIPGFNSRVFSYLLPYGLSSISFEKKFPYGSDNFLLLVSDPGAKVDLSPSLPSKVVTLQGKNFLAFQGAKIKNNDIIKVKISSLPLAINIVKIGAISFGLFLVILIAFISYNYNKKKGEKRGSVRSKEELEEEKRLILHEIAYLDEEKEKGRISEELYGRIRKEKKDRIEKITSIL